METLIRELESLRHKPQLTTSEVVGVMLATAMRLKEVLDVRMVGIQALASAIAAQPEIDVMKLHDEYLRVLKSHFDSVRRIPVELRDVAASIKLAAAERR